MPSVNRGSQHISLYFSFLVFIFGMLNSVIFFFFVFIQKLLCCCCCCWNLFFKRTDWQIVIYWQFQVDDVITTTTHLDRLKSCFILTIFLLLFFCFIFCFFFFNFSPCIVMTLMMIVSLLLLCVWESLQCDMDQFYGILYDRK